jgi:hypothetical protein
MSTTTLAPQAADESLGDSIQQQIAVIVDDLIAQLPNPKRLTSEQRRGIIARYTAVLEGNFIYWMTATSIAVKSDEVRPILAENLFEEVRDSHPAMLRRFAIAAHAFPTDKDALSVDAELTAVRLFLGKLQGVQSVLTMAFFECWIQRFMGYLADLAADCKAPRSWNTPTSTAFATSRIRLSCSAHCNWRWRSIRSARCGSVRGRRSSAHADQRNRSGSHSKSLRHNRTHRVLQCKTRSIRTGSLRSAPDTFLYPARIFTLCFTR